MQLPIIHNHMPNVFRFIQLLPIKEHIMEVILLSVLCKIEVVSVTIITIRMLPRSLIQVVIVDLTILWVIVHFLLLL